MPSSHGILSCPRLAVSRLSCICGHDSCNLVLSFHISNLLEVAIG